MSITFQVLGGPGRDNALWVRLDTGQAVHRLLFDCGEGCLSALPFAEVQAIDHLFFSHLHMDHVGGFDTFFRAVYDRTAKPNVLWGPEDTGRILHHRFQGYLWNLHHGRDATWRVHDLLPGRTRATRFELAEAFATAHTEEEGERTDLLLDTPDFTVHAFLMDHATPSVAYLVREKARQNVEVARLAGRGLSPGPWLQQLKNPRPGQTAIDIGGTSHPLAELRAELITETPGDSVAYLTDFLLDESAIESLAGPLRGCGAVVCESQYRSADEELAVRNHHMTAAGAAELARRADVGELVLFHLSDRYPRDEWPALLAEARAIFPRTRFPAHWDLG